MDSMIIKKNVIWSVLCQGVSIVCGFLIPRIIISTFGSETNGLIASINQFLNYVTILEGGVSGVAVAALYRPLYENDKDKISCVIRAIRQYFTKLGLICVCFTIVVAFAYPYFVDSDKSYQYVFFLTLILGIKLIVQNCLSATYRILLRADQKVYYISITHIVITIFHLILVFFLVRLSDNVLMVYGVSSIAYLFTPLFYIVFIKKHYLINWKIKHDNSVLSQRWDGFGHNLAFFIHTNTDVVLLTVFSSLSNVSVYSIYIMIAYALQGLVNTISSAIAPSMGTILTRDNIEESRAFFFDYEFIIVLLSFFFFTCGMELIVPFVSVYTFGVSDADYIQPVFGILILLAEMMCCIRDPYINVAYGAGHYKQTAKYAYIEAGLNILLSIILIQQFGLIGVAIGTFVSMGVRTVFQVHYLEKTILFCKGSLFYKKIGIYAVVVVISVIVSKLIIPIQMSSYVQWIPFAVIGVLLTLALFFVANYIFYKEDLTNIILKLLRKNATRKMIP